MNYDYDLFVIGAGSGGLAASRRAAAFGARVAVAEADLIGGTCVNRGCTPKKMMVYAADFSGLFRDAEGFGWSPIDSQFDWQKLIAVKDQELKRLNQIFFQRLEEAGVKFIPGFASFLDPHTLDVNGVTFTADKILVAVGGKPALPPIPGVEHGITSDDIFHLTKQPQKIAILGGGYIGVEFASILNGMGSQVMLIVRGDRILSRFDHDLQTAVQEGMMRHGIQILTETTVKRIDRDEAGIHLTLSGNKSDALTVDTVLLATGRVPNLHGLGLQNAGLHMVKGSEQCESEISGYCVKDAIAVDAFSRTVQPHIFAVGDCTNRVNLTPVAIAEGRAFVDSEFGNSPRSIEYEYIPSAVFTRPEAATVGLTEAAARSQFGDVIQCYCTTFRPLYHTLSQRDEKTLIKLVVEQKADRVLGAHVVGEGAAEMIQGIALALNLGATKKDFDRTIGIHPSSAEEFFTLR